MFGFWYKKYTHYSNVNANQLGYYRELQRRCKKKFGKQIFTISFKARDVWGNLLPDTVSIWIDKSYVRRFHLMNDIFSLEKKFEKGILKRISKEDFLKLEENTKFYIIYVNEGLWYDLNTVECTFKGTFKGREDDLAIWFEELGELGLTQKEQSIIHIMPDGEFTTNGFGMNGSHGLLYSLQELTSYEFSIDSK